MPGGDAKYQMSPTNRVAVEAPFAAGVPKMKNMSLARGRKLFHIDLSIYRVSVL